MKRIVSLALLLLTALSVAVFAVSCGDDYRDDLSTAKLADEVIVALDDGVTYLSAREGYLDDYLTIPADVTDYRIFIAQNGNANINEIGIFRLDGKADGFAEELKTYLAESYRDNKEFYNGYIPEETPKLRDAEVRVYGNYAVYAILSADDRETVFSTVGNLLKK